MSIHKSKQWIEKREKFIEGKVCEWCGSTDQLSIHHKNPPKVGIGPYNKIANEYYQEYFKDGNNESELKQYFEEIYPKWNPDLKDHCPRCKKASIYERTTMSPRYRCIPCGYLFDDPINEPTKKSMNWFWNQVFLIFKREHKTEIQNMYADYKSQTAVEYLNFSEDDVIILCKKCHYIAGKGKVLCSKCKEKYHDKKWDTCFACSEDTFSYVQPWCEKSFIVHKKYEGMTRTPEECCMSVCPEDPDNCDIAKKNSDVFSW